MQFQRLRIAGFKSFVDPVDFRIEPGLTGIVGPNGCGKSNLLEALRWVMGANSAKAMRASEMDDVITQDTEATGEDRRSYLMPFASRARVPAGPGQAGYRVGLPWGGGPIIAANPASARPLIVDMIRASPGSRLAFPEVNAHGAALAVSFGFHLARRVRRMRLGPPVPGYRPGTIYNVFSLGVG